MRQNELNFRKRQDVWRSYRDSIYKDSSRHGSYNSSENRINKYIKTINSIDKSILQDLNKTDFNLSSGSHAKIDFSSQYSALSFEFNKLDSSIINNLNEEINTANNIRNESKFIDANGDFVYIKTEKITKLDEMLKNIYNSISTISDDIKNFPILAKEDLKILEGSLKFAKSKSQEPLNPELKVDSEKIKEGKDFKIPYFISLIGLTILLVIIIIIAVLMIVLW